MITRNTLLASIFMLLSLSNAAQGDSTTCRSMDDVVKQTIKALNTGDSKMFLVMFDTAVMLRMMEAEVAKDSGSLEIVGKLKDMIDELAIVHERQFFELLMEVKKKLKTMSPEIEYDHYKIRSTEKGPSTHYTTEVRVLAGGRKFSFSMDVAKYKGCHYVVVPLDGYFSEDDW